MKKIVGKLFICLAVTMLVKMSLNFPYINIASIFFNGIVPFSFMISVLLVFRPKKSSILKFGLILIGMNFVFVLIKSSYLAEIFSVLGYFLIFLYIVISLPRILEKT